MDRGVGPKGPRCLEAFSWAELVVLRSRVFYFDFCPHQVHDLRLKKTEHVFTDLLPFSSTQSTISIRVQFRWLVLLKGSFCSSCCYCFMLGGLARVLQIEMVTSLPPAAPVPASIDNIRHLKCILRGSIPYCAVNDREGGPHLIHLGSFGSMLKIELSKVYFNSSVANHQRETEPRHVAAASRRCWEVNSCCQQQLWFEMWWKIKINRGLMREMKWGISTFTDFPWCKEALLDLCSWGYFHILLYSYFRATSQFCLLLLSRFQEFTWRLY